MIDFITHFSYAFRGGSINQTWQELKYLYFYTRNKLLILNVLIKRRFNFTLSQKEASAFVFKLSTKQVRQLEVKYYLKSQHAFPTTARRKGLEELRPDIDAGSGQLSGSSCTWGDIWLPWLHTGSPHLCHPCPGNHSQIIYN